MRSAGMHPGCCSHPGRNHNRLVEVERRSFPVVARSRGRGTGKFARRSADSRRPNDSRVDPTQHTMVARLVVVAGSAVGEDTVSSPAVVVGVGIGHSLTAAAVAVGPLNQSW